LLQCQWLLLATQINDHSQPKVGYFEGWPIYLFIFTKTPSFLPLCSLKSRHLRPSGVPRLVYFLVHAQIVLFLEILPPHFSPGLNELGFSDGEAEEGDFLPSPNPALPLTYSYVWSPHSLSTTS